MYKIIVFSKLGFHHTKKVFLGIFEPSFRESHWNFFVIIFTCQKWLFWLKFLENRPFNCQRIRPQLRNLFQTILRKFLHGTVQTHGVALCCLKSNGHFTISLPVRIFVNHEKNYHFVIVSLSNHESTLKYIYDTQNYVFSSAYELWIVIKLLNKTLKLF